MASKTNETTFQTPMIKYAIKTHLGQTACLFALRWS